MDRILVCVHDCRNSTCPLIIWNCLFEHARLLIMSSQLRANYIKVICFDNFERPCNVSMKPPPLGGTNLQISHFAQLVVGKVKGVNALLPEDSFLPQFIESR